MGRVTILIIPIAVALSLLIASCTKSPTADATAAKTQVTTFAGNGMQGSAYGPNLTASFGNPYSIAVDTLGNVYVGDVGNNTVDVINPIWGVSLLAQFNSSAGGTIRASGLAVGADGTLYCVDEDFEELLKISPAGVVTVFAGNAYDACTNGIGMAASFGNPYGAAVDAAGNVYVADGDCSSIRKITTSGIVTTLAGEGNNGYVDGIGTVAQFGLPIGVAVNAEGIVYVADENNNCIRQISPSGVVTTLAGDALTHGDYADGIGTDARFNAPTGIAVDKQGNIYVSDSRNNRIRKIDPYGEVSTLAGTGQAGAANGLASAATFNNPIGIAVDTAGNIYVADFGNYLIRKISINQ
jgi:serine/threonine protein kinase, bacterial